MRKRDSGTADGVLLVDKPEGITSHGVVARLRGALGQRRIGHAGTLDPSATGLLVALLGSATRLQSYILGADKAYTFDLVLGVATDSLDLDGAVLREAPVSDEVVEALMAALPRFVGSVSLVPPMVSALHHEGRRLYELAREGTEVVREPRQSTIHLLRQTAPPARDGERLRVPLEVHCSSGTYVRSLGEALASAIGLPGAIDRLRRTETGGYRVEDAQDLEELVTDPASARLRPPNALVRHLPAASLSREDAGRFLHGNVVTWNGSEGGEIRVEYGDLLLGLGSAEAGRLRPTRVLVGEDRVDV